MKTTKYQKEKVLLSLSRYIVDEVNRYVIACDNPSINRSVVVEAILDEVFIHNKKILDKLFENDKRYKN